MRIKEVVLSISLLISTAYAQKYVEYQKPAQGNDVVGEVIYVVPKDHESLVDLTIRYEMGYEELKWANPGINAWMLSDKRPLALPTQFILPQGKRSGIVSNIPEMRTYYFPKNSDKVYIYPVGVGRMDWKTPLGSWSVTRKQEDPAWYPPESIRREHEEMGRGTLPRVVPAGPDNPLGTRVLRLSLPSYLLHGTNEQTGIGMRVTHGCMRFYPQHITHLYDMVPTNTTVTFLNEPVKYGFAGNDLLIEVHPPLEEDNMSVADLLDKANSELAKFLKPYPNASVNYDLITIAVQQQTGLPVIVGEKDATVHTPAVSHAPTLQLYSESDSNASSAAIPSSSYSNVQNNTQISAPSDVTASPKFYRNGQAAKQESKSRSKDVTVIKKEIRLTPDPATIVVPESSDSEITFPEPSSSSNFRSRY